jgi:hypothetical protein
MILMAPCIIDFIGANGLCGPVGGGGGLDTPVPLNGIERKFKKNVQRAVTPDQITQQNSLQWSEGP